MKKTITLFVCIAVALASSVAIYLLNYYVHESGHLITGLIINLYSGNSQIPYFSLWDNEIGIPYPVQTAGVPTNAIVALSGPVFSIIYAILVVLLFYRLKKTQSRINERWFFPLIIAIFLLFTIQTVIGDIIYGGDNWNSSPFIVTKPSVFIHIITIIEASKILVVFIVMCVWCLSKSGYCTSPSSNPSASGYAGERR